MLIKFVSSSFVLSMKVNKQIFFVTHTVDVYVLSTEQKFIH